MGKTEIQEDKTTRARPHRTLIIIFIAELFAGAVISAGLFYYFEYSNTPKGWNLPVLFGVCVFTIICNVFLIVSSGARSSSSLTVMPCFLVMGCCAIILSMVWIIINYVQSKNTLKDCEPKNITPSTCAKLFETVFCGDYILEECRRLETGLVLGVSGFVILFGAQIGNFIVALKRRSQILRDEYSYAEVIYQDQFSHASAHFLPINGNGFVDSNGSNGFGETNADGIIEEEILINNGSKNSKRSSKII